MGSGVKKKLKPYEDKVIKYFQSKKVPKENASYKCLSLIVLWSVIRVNKKYYPQRLLQECNYILKNNKVENLNSDDLDTSSSDESGSKFDYGSDNGSYSESND